MELTSTSFKSKLLAEARSSLQLAVPLTAAQLATAGINVIGTVIMGFLGTQNLAAGALGAVPFSFLSVICTATISAVGVNAAEAFGAKNTDKLSRILSSGLWLAAALSFPAMIFLWYSDTILPFLGQEESNVLLAKNYIRAVMWGFPAAVGFSVLTDTASAVNRPFAITAIMIAELLLSVPANYALAFGKWGFPDLGLAGIGWASTVILWLGFIAAACWLALSPSFREYKLFSHLHQFDKVLFSEIFLLGAPTGIQLAGDMGMYASISLFMGILGTESLAAYTIVMRTSLIPITVVTGISYATTMRVGQRMGEKAPLDAKRAVVFDIALSTVFACIVALIFWLFAQPIVAIYLDVNNVDNVETVAKAVSFFPLGGIYVIDFGVEFIAVSALLGLKDTRVPMLINLVTTLGLGLAGSYLMGFTLGWGGVGLWWGLIGGLATAAVVLIWRLALLFNNYLEEE